MTVSEYLGGRRASISQGFLSGLLEDRPGESPGPFSPTAPAGFSITGSESRFVLADKRSAGFPGFAPGRLFGGFFADTASLRRLISRNYRLLIVSDNSFAGYETRGFHG